MAIAESIVCPKCHSEDVVGTGRGSGGVIELRCRACDTSWPRTPATPCPRCASLDVEVTSYMGWAYDDLEEARENPMADYSEVERIDYRCHSCRNTWR